MGAYPKTSTDEMLEIIKNIVKKKDESQKILIKKSRLQTEYKIEKGINISKVTLSNYGFCDGGYFPVKYPDVFTWINEGSRRYWGMLIDKEAFINEIGLKEKEIEVNRGPKKWL